jgi:hypothetical protein
MSIALKKRLEYIEQAQVEMENMLDAELKRGCISMSHEIAELVHTNRVRELAAEENSLIEKENAATELKVNLQWLFASICICICTCACPLIFIIIALSAHNIILLILLSKHASDVHQLRFQECKEKLKTSRVQAEQNAPIFQSDESGNRVVLPLKEKLDAFPMDRAVVTYIKKKHMTHREHEHLMLYVQMEMCVCCNG